MADLAIQHEAVLNEIPFQGALTFESRKEIMPELSRDELKSLKNSGV
jgi:hypothetical protein